jgi:hypothetical protein
VPVGEHLLLTLCVERKAVLAHEFVGEQRAHPLLAAADLELLAVLLLGPPHGQTHLGEGLIERRPVTVALGVGEHTVTVEDQRGHAARQS